MFFFGIYRNLINNILKCQLCHKVSAVSDVSVEHLASLEPKPTLRAGSKPEESQAPSLAHKIKRHTSYLDKRTSCKDPAHPAWRLVSERASIADTRLADTRLAGLPATIDTDEKGRLCWLTADLELELQCRGRGNGERGSWGWSVMVAAHGRRDMTVGYGQG